MKKLFAMLMALSMMLTMFAGCSTTAPAPESPVSAPEPVSVSEPTPAPSIVEGVVKEASLSKIIVTLADGTDFALDTTKVTDMKVNLGDEVKVEYTGAPGSAVASKVDVTKAAPVEETVTGVVKEVSTSMMLLTLEDESELVLLTKDVEGLEALEIKVGDKISATYLMGDTGAVASAVEVVEDAAPDDGSSSGASDAGTSSQSSTPAVPASSSSSASSAPAPNSNSASGSSNNAGGNSGNWLQDYANWALGGQGNGNSNNNDSNNDDDDDEEDYTSSSKPTESQPENKPTETTPEPEPEPEPSEDAGDVYEAIRLINAERAKAGLAELTIDDDLMSMAAVRAAELPEKFDHTRPDGSDWKTVFGEFGVEVPYKRGENAGRGKDTASKQVNSWMNSSGHKANILKDNVTKIGVGYCYGDGAEKKNYWIMIVTN